MMAACTAKASSIKYHNWIKAGLALLITKEGIEDFVYDEIELCQIQTLANICSTNGLAPGTMCNSCRTVNVLKCPTRLFCKTTGSGCMTHDSTVNQYHVCSNMVCDDFRESIKNAHRYHGPSFKNTDSTKWCSDVWEVAKCFMPPDGYSNVRSVAETDFNGIVSVIINYTGFQNKMTDDLSKPGNIADLAREEGRKIRHSPNFELDTKDLTECFDRLTNLLTDSKYLLQDRKAQAAAATLRQLQMDTLVIRADDVQKVLKDAATVLQTGIIDDVKTRRLKILNDITGALCSLEMKKQNCFDAVATALSQLKDIGRTEEEKLKKFGSEALDELEKKRISTEAFTKKSKEELEDISKNEQQKLRDAGIEIYNRVGKKEMEIFKRLNTADETTKFENFVKGLQKHLLRHYKVHCSYLPISPLLQDEDELLDDFYVQPSIQRVEHHKAGVQPVPLKTFKEIFTRDGQKCRRIFITGDAGTGKTVFCQRLVSVWCRAMVDKVSTEKESTKMLKRDVDFMKEFPFVFYVSLRDARPDECSIHEILSSQLEIQDTTSLLRVLQEKKCLILVDGLDEWEHPKNQEKCNRQQSKQPHLDYTGSCSVVITTRPWKLDVLQLGKKDIDQKIEIKGFQNPAMMREYEYKVIKLLNSRTEPEGTMTTAAFEEKISDLVDEDLKTNPLIVLNLICMWFMGKSLGPSKCRIYSDSLEMMFQRSSERDIRESFDQQVSEFVESGKLLSVPKVCFQGNPNCQQHLDAMYCLSHLAFNTLFSDSEYSSLVFDRSAGQIHGLSCDQIETLCKIGILSKSKVVGNLLSRKSKVSFIHKTYHEFFAALFICFSGLSTNILNSFKQTVRSIEKIVEMQNVFIFLSGMAPHIIEQLRPVLTFVINDDPQTKSYRRMMFHTEVYEPHERQASKFVRNLEECASRCYRECKKAVGVELIFPVEDLYIPLKPSSEKLQMLKLSSIKSVVFVGDYIDDFDKNNLEMLVFFPARNTNKPLQETFSLLSARLEQNLKCLVFHCGCFGMVHFDSAPLNTFLQTSYLGFLETISLEGLNSSNSMDICIFIETLKKFHNLKKLRLVRIDADGRPEFDFSCFKSLRELTIIDFDIHIVIDNPDLEACHIQNTRGRCYPAYFDYQIFFHEPVTSFVLRNAAKLKTFLMLTGILDADLTSALRQLVDLRRIILSKCVFIDADAPSFLQKNMGHLTYVSLQNVTFSEKCFKDFLESIPQTEFSVHVVLETCILWPKYSDTDKWMHDIVANMPRFQIVYQDEKKLKFKTSTMFA